MRIIKFRIWDTKSIPPEWKYYTIQQLIEGEADWCGHDDQEPQQFTGLLDSDGKEIYEGDIIELTNVVGLDRGRHVVALEEYGDDCYGYWWYSYLKHDPDEDEELSHNSVTVIGNVFA